jgi:hypothetical protein
MRWSNKMRFIILIATCWCLPAGFLLGDVLVLNDSNAPPVYGRIIEQTEQTVVLDEISGSDLFASKRVEFATNEIQLIIKNFDERRLADLDPADLSAYRDYAEELAAQQADPVARGLAIRLLMIVAYGAGDSASGQSMKRGALKGLMDLARNERETQGFRTLFAMYGGEVDLLERSQTVDTAEVQSDPGNNDDVMLKIVRLLRQGANSKVLLELEDKSNATAIERWADICGPTDLARMAKQNRLQTEDLRRLLTIELAIENGQTAEQVISSQKSSGDNLPYDWGADAERTVPALLRLPRLQRITEFDPRDKIYRDGRWIRPDANR